MQRRTFLKWTIPSAVAFAAGVATQRYLFSANRAPVIVRTSTQANSIYVCPMHPQIISDKPGTCPICGMALVPKGTSAQAGPDMDAEPVVQIEPEVINNLGVKLARVTRTTLVRRIETPGFVQQIEPAQHVRVRAPIAARIAALHVKSGQWLEAGKPLVTFESDTLLAAERTHIALLRNDRAASKGSQESILPGAAAPTEHGMTLEESRAQLARLGLSDDAIRELERKRAPSARATLYAPYPGRITNLQVAAGAAVKSEATLLELSGMARATVLANAFQRDAAWIQNGQAVDVSLPHVSNRSWPGVVNQGAIAIDPSSQNIGVRLSFTAPAEVLKSAMYVVATIHGDAHPGVLAVPADALIRTESEDRVIVALGGGRFKPVPVRPGIETGGQVEILGGLREGDQIVVSAQFLIDSESSLQASFRRMTAR